MERSELVPLFWGEHMIRISDGHLRLLEERDLRTVLHWRNSLRIRESMFSDQVIVWEDHCRWYERMCKDSSIVYLLFEYDNQPAGVVHFAIQSERDKRCLWGFYLGEESFPRGVGSLMGYLALKYAFESLGTHKVSGEVLSHNKISLRFHEKLGFIKEGYFKHHILKNGTYLDVIFYSLLHDTWLSNHDEIWKRIFSAKKDV